MQRFHPLRGTDHQHEILRPAPVMPEQERAVGVFELTVRRQHQHTGNQCTPGAGQQCVVQSISPGQLQHIREQIEVLLGRGEGFQPGDQRRRLLFPRLQALQRKLQNQVRSARWGLCMKIPTRPVGIVATFHCPVTLDRPAYVTKADIALLVRADLGLDGTGARQQFQGRRDIFACGQQLEPARGSRTQTHPAPASPSANRIRRNSSARNRIKSRAISARWA
jgi:hypothetical protein